MVAQSKPFGAGSADEGGKPELRGGFPLEAAHCEGAAVGVAQVAPSPSAAESVVFPEQAKPLVQAARHPTYTAFDVCNSLLAGGIAGGVSRTAVAPLERLKILLQVQNAHSAKYSGMFQGLKTMWQTEGLRGFFRGNGTNCIRIVPNSAVKFLCFDMVSDSLLWFARKQPGNENIDKTPIINLCSGAIAGIIAMTSVYPLDMVRGRITVQTADAPPKYKGIVHALVTVSREEGVVALYKGWVPSLIGVVPYVGLNFAVYETLKDVCVKQLRLTDGRKEDLGYLTRFTCGATAGIVGQTVAYPLDVVRRRMQMVGAHYNGMTDAFRKTVKYEGFGALYKGLLPNSVKVVPSIAISFVTYEFLREKLGVKFKIPE